jgi:hypothetical protein
MCVVSFYLLRFTAQILILPASKKEDKRKMNPQIAERTLRQFVNEVSDQYYTMTGTVLAAIATQTAALAEACMQISLDKQVDKLDWPDVTTRIEQMAHIKDTLLEWCNQHTTQMTGYMASAGYSSEPQQLLCDHAAEIGFLSVQAATVLQDFRPLVFEQVNDDLEMTLNLLVMVSKTAMLLLDSHLRRWPDEALLAEYEPIRATLEQQINLLTPRERIRSSS